MINVTVNKGECAGNLEGTAADLFTDLLVIVGGVYYTILDENPEEAEIFKHALKEAILLDAAFVDKDAFGEFETLSV